MYGRLVQRFFCSKNASINNKSTFSRLNQKISKIHTLDNRKKIKQNHMAFKITKFQKISSNPCILNLNETCFVRDKHGKRKLVHTIYKKTRRISLLSNAENLKQLRVTLDWCAWNKVSLIDTLMISSELSTDR